MQNPSTQAKEVICQIIAAAGGELNKKVALFKAFYYAHLYYWQDGEELDIYVDLLEEEEYLRLKQRLQTTEDMVNRVFAENP